MNKAIFLDRDGTINIDTGYVYRINDFQFINKAVDGLKLLQNFGFLLIVVTNQSGIGRGYFTFDDYWKLQNYIDSELAKSDVKLTATYLCPHTDSDYCSCRKPKLELYYKAMYEYNLNLSKCFAIGDNIRDLSICNSEPVTGILLTGNDNYNFLTFNTLLDSAKYIVSHEKNS